MKHAIVLLIAETLLQTGLQSWALNPAHQESRQDRASAQAEITTIQVGTGPQGIAFTPGAVWVAWGDDRNFGVTRIDAATLEKVATIRTGKWPVGIAAGEGAVWAANRNDNTVSRIDPETNQVVATIAVERSPLCVAVGEGSVWVSHGEMRVPFISRIDPKTNTVIAKIRVGLSPSGIAVSNGSVWVANYGQASISRVDPKTNKVTKTVMLYDEWDMTVLGPRRRELQPNQIVSWGDTLWVTAADRLLRIDAKTSKITARIPVPPAKPLSNSLLGGMVRYPNLKNDLDWFHSTPGRPTGVAVMGDVLWVADWEHNVLWKIDVPTAKTFGVPLPVGSQPLILGPGRDGAGAFWVSNAGDGTVMRVKP